MSENVSQDLKNFINAIGAIAEMTAAYRSSLVAQKIPQQEVVPYVCAFINSIVPSPSKQQDFD